MTIRREDLDKTDFSDIVEPGEVPMRIRTHPGEILREILDDTGLSARALARDLDVPVTRITEILHGERAVTARTAVLLGRRFDMTPEFWMNLQVSHDLDEAKIALGRAA